MRLQLSTFCRVVAIVVTLVFLSGGIYESRAAEFKPDLWKNTAVPIELRAARAIERKMRELALPEPTSTTTFDAWTPPFYSGVRIVRVHDGWKPVNLFLYFLVKDGRHVEWLDGTSMPIHRFNARHGLNINPGSVKPYLWFFTFFVRGEEGPFLVVESSNDTFIPKDRKSTDQNTRQSFARFPTPISCERGTGKDAFVCDAVVMYSNAMFKSDFRIQKSGMVAMAGDVPVAADLSVKIYAPINPKKLKNFVAAKKVTPRGPARPRLDVSRAPAPARSALRDAVAGRALTLTAKNTPYLAGIAANLAGRCSVPRGFSDRAALKAWAASGFSSMIFGSDYSNPDLGAAIGSQLNSIAGVSAGTEFGKRIPCGPAAQVIATAILKAVRQMEGRDSNNESLFVSSCSNRHGTKKCECIAGVVRGTMPDIHRQVYAPHIIKGAIQRNPLTGFMMMACGVTQY
ncbi:MAG: hypothetical protein AAFQ42_08555 [Pseudomonadota bacterium]